MKTTTLIRALTSLTTAMAVAAPVVVFGFLYVLKVGPARSAAAEARADLAAAQAELTRQRLSIAPGSFVVEASAGDDFDARTSEGDVAAAVVEALTTLLNSPSVGGVSNLSIETSAAVEGSRDSMVRIFARPVAHTVVTATFDARYDQVGRFFWNLRVLPTTFDLQSLELELAPGGRGLMRAKVSLLAFRRLQPGTPIRASQPETVDVLTTPQWTRDPFAKQARSTPVAKSAAAPPPEAEPVVSGILISGGRRVAQVDGRIVRQGDRLGNGIVQSIEPDAVVIATDNGEVRRVQVRRPVR